MAIRSALHYGLVAASVIAAACGNATSATPAIGDSCLVGRWVQTSSITIDRSTPGITVTTTGGDGYVVTFTAAGDETDDYSNTAPGISKSSDGHTEIFTFRGTMHYKFHAAAGRWTESEQSGEITVTSHTIDGVSQPDASMTVPSGSGTYKCAGSTLTIIQGQTTVVFAKAA
jgi:hypothetical protein